jgi:SAM-dependent methyltransferase
MSFLDHFSGHARQYAEFRPTYPVELFQWLSRLAPGRDLAWDCATGNGQAAVPLAEFFERVEATDASAEQIVNATPHPKVRYRVAPAESSGLESACADLVTIAQALHWMPFEAFFSEVNRVLRPGGVFAAWGYNFVQCKTELDAILVEHLYQPIASHWPPERRWVDDRYRTIPFPFEELMPPEFTIHVRWDAGHLLGYLSTWSGTRRWIQEEGPSGWDRLEAQVRARWPSGEREFEIPLDLRVGRKR